MGAVQYFLSQVSTPGIQRINEVVLSCNPGCNLIGNALLRGEQVILKLKHRGTQSQISCLTGSHFCRDAIGQGGDGTDLSPQCGGQHALINLAGQVFNRLLNGRTCHG